jgi:integrase|tara:strand:- start:106 stop:1296 length:1191 start_codon:yes stop_codon:yes gene_type:complete
MQINRATVTRLLKKKAASKEMQDNLYAQVGSGKRMVIYFRFYWTEFGERQYRKIGSANADTPASTLKELNAHYLQMLGRYQQGISPSDTDRMMSRAEKAEQSEKERLASRVTVEQIFKQYLENHLVKSSPDQYDIDLGRYNNHIHKPLGKKFAEDVTKKQIQACVDAVVDKGYEPQAHYIAEYIKRVWIYAIDAGHEDLSERVVTRIKKPKKPKREREATEEELRLILKYGDPVIKAMLYMGQRVSDTRTMRKANVKDNWLEITPDEYKTDIYHRVYLTKTVQKLMQESTSRSQSDVFVWAGYNGNCISESKAHEAFHQIGLDEIKEPHLDPLQLRDFRRTLYTFNEKHFNTYVAGAVAGHKKKGVTAVYGRYEYDEEKIKAMKKWEQYLNKLSKG